MRRFAEIACFIAVMVVCSGSAARAEAPADSSLASPAADRAPAPSGRAPAPPALPPGPGHWFYQRLPYGSEALADPWRLVFNGGFGTLQFDNRSNRLSDVPWRHGWRRLGEDLKNPVKTIEVGGWDDFLGTEIIPVSVNRKNAQYWPNYTLHLIGGGMSSVMMHEWFTQHGFRHPGVGEAVTMTAYDLLNETVEAGGRFAPSTDAIADLLVFDPAGIWLFSHEGVSGFFSRRLHLRDWSSQPAIDPSDGAVVNNGQNFSIKLAIPHTDRWSLFYYFGNHGEAGLSYRFRDGSALSAGGGLLANGLVQLGKGAQTTDLVPSGGVFYDRNGSLLLSVSSANTSRDAVRVNVYPGFLRVHGWTAGLFALRARSHGLVLGVNLTQLPLGIAGIVK